MHRTLALIFLMISMILFISCGGDERFYDGNNGIYLDAYSDHYTLDDISYLNEGNPDQIAYRLTISLRDNTVLLHGKDVEKWNTIIFWTEAGLKSKGDGDNLFSGPTSFDTPLDQKVWGIPENSGYKYFNLLDINLRWMRNVTHAPSPVSLEDGIATAPFEDDFCLTLPNR